ncbi:hypothetical protein LguiA_015927 [Lonicera macranthoides]
MADGFAHHLDIFKLIVDGSVRDGESTYGGYSVIISGGYSVIISENGSGVWFSGDSAPVGLANT